MQEVESTIGQQNKRLQEEQSGASELHRLAAMMDVGKRLDRVP